MHVGAAEDLLVFLVLALDGLDHEDDIAVFHDLFRAVQGVGALQEVALAAGDLIGLEGKLFRYTVVHAGEVDGLGTANPIHHLLGNGNGEGLFHFIGQGIQLFGDILAGEFPDHGFKQQGLFHYALGGSYGIFPATTQHDSLLAHFLQRSAGVGGYTEVILVTGGLQLLGQHEGFFGATGIGVQQDGILVQLVLTGLVGAFRVGNGIDAPAQGLADGVLGWHDAAGTFAGE